MRTPSRPAEVITVADLEADPHPVLARLRDAAPVCWVPVLVPGWSPGTTGRRRAARRPDVHGRRPPVLHGQGGRAEHALAGRRAACAPPGSVHAPVPGRGGPCPARSFTRGRGRPAGVGHPAARRGRTAPRRGRAAGRAVMAEALGLAADRSGYDPRLVRRHRGGRAGRSRSRGPRRQSGPPPRPAPIRPATRRPPEAPRSPSSPPACARSSPPAGVCQQCWPERRAPGR